MTTPYKKTRVVEPETQETQQLHVPMKMEQSIRERGASVGEQISKEEYQTDTPPDQDVSTMSTLTITENSFDETTPDIETIKPFNDQNKDPSGIETIFDNIVKPTSNTVTKNIEIRLLDNLIGRILLCHDLYSPYKTILNLNKKIYAIEKSYMNDVLSNLLQSTNSLKVQKGGAFREDCENEIVEQLKINEIDSFHDFQKGERNKVWPGGEGIMTNMGVLNKLREILATNTTTGSNNLSAFIDNSRGSFEEDIKIAYLIGMICGDMPEVNFYFSRGDSVNLPKSFQNDIRQKFFTVNPPNSIEDLIGDLKTTDHTNWLLDAAIDIQEHLRKIGGFEQKFSLCNLWDGVGKLQCPASQLESNMRQKIGDFDSYGKKFDLYDWLENDESIYEKIYDPLLNEGLLEGEGIKFKLKLAARVTDNLPDNARYYYVVLILQQNETNPLYFVLDNQITKVVALAEGMEYVRQNFAKNYEIDSILKSIIDQLRFMIGNVNRELTKNKICKVLTRFKSSGDHGTADTTGYIANCTFLTGDSLAGVYAIAKNEPHKIPTLLKFYTSNKLSEEEYERYIAAYLPQTETIEKIKNKITVYKEYILGLYELTISVQGLSPFKIGDIVDLSNMKELLNYLFDLTIKNSDEYNQLLKTIKIELAKFDLENVESDKLVEMQEILELIKKICTKLLIFENRRQIDDAIDVKTKYEIDLVKQIIFPPSLLQKQVTQRESSRIKDRPPQAAKDIQTLTNFLNENGLTIKDFIGSNREIDDSLKKRLQSAKKKIISETIRDLVLADKIPSNLEKDLNLLIINMQNKYRRDIFLPTFEELHCVDLYKYLFDDEVKTRTQGATSAGHQMQNFLENDNFQKTLKKSVHNLVEQEIAISNPSKFILNQRKTLFVKEKRSRTTTKIRVTKKSHPHKKPKIVSHKPGSSKRNTKKTPGKTKTKKSKLVK